MRGGMHVLVFENLKVCDAFDHRGRVCSTSRHHEGDEFLAVCVFFFLPGLGARCITVCEYNKGARHLARNPVRASNSKHIDIGHHFLPELVFKGEFAVVAVESEEQHADFLTKALAGTIFRFITGIL